MSRLRVVVPVVSTLLAFATGPIAAQDAGGDPSTSGLPEEVQAPNTEEKVLYELNLGLYKEVEREHSGENYLIPFYSYAYDERSNHKEFVLWPLLTGYYADSNSDYFFSFPILTLAGSYKDPEREMSGFVALPILTFGLDEKSSDGVERSQWFSLPLLSLSQSQRVTQPDATFEYTTHASILFQNRNIRLDYKQADGSQESVRMHRWALTPIHLKQEIDFCTFRDSTWNQERETQFLYLWDFAVFNYHVRENYSYPGAYLNEYEWVLQDAQGHDKSVIRPDMIEGGRETEPISHVGFLDPILSFESTSGPYSRTEFLPFFTHTVHGEQDDFHVIPLFTTFQEDGVRFDPVKSFSKMWPLAYWDENRRKADILWPLITWEDQDDLKAFRVRTRFLFDYQRRGTYQRFDLVEGLLYDHKWGKGRRSVDVLGGLLYAEEERPEPGISRWEILKGLIYGEEETPEASYIKVFLLKFKTRDKVPPAAETERK